MGLINFNVGPGRQPVYEKMSNFIYLLQQLKLVGEETADKAQTILSQRPTKGKRNR